MTVDELIGELTALSLAGHGGKDIGFPEGFHASGGGVGERVVFDVAENDTPEDKHPGFVWIEIKGRP